MTIRFWDDNYWTLETYLNWLVSIFWSFRIIDIIYSWTIGIFWGLDVLVRPPKEVSVGAIHDPFWVVTNLVSKR